ncbi:MAG: 5-methylthioadenosine deaminase [Robiginitomaculum sp.]|nr:MAG: 5-methylthioadenosine deaminase [Robiginitomaculum sp.]
MSSLPLVRSLFAIILLALPVSALARDKADMIVYGDYVLSMEKEGGVLKNGAVAIKDGAILAVGPRADIDAKFKAAKKISGTNKVLMPGLINGHTHAAMVLFRGMADDMTLIDWLQNYIFPMEGEFVDEDFVRAGAQLACWEMVRGGTTTIVDMYFYPDVAAKVYETCGIRAILGAPMIDYPSPGFKGWDDSFAAGKDFVANFKDPSGKLIPAFAPHGAYTVSPDHLKAVLAAAKAAKAPLMMHVAESPSEMTVMKARYHNTSVRHIAGLGMLDYPLIAAHMVWPDEDEMDMMAMSGKTGVIHNPTSNMKTAAGFSPVPQMIAKGINVGLGTDGAASNNDLDMWEEIRLAALLHKGKSGDATVMPADTVLAMATRMGAAAIGLGDVTGTLSPGKRADMIQLTLTSPRMEPLYDIESHLVYVAGSRDVVMTMVDGQVLMQNGTVRTLNAKTVIRDARVQADKIRTALEAGETPAKN